LRLELEQERERHARRKISPDQTRLLIQDAKRAVSKLSVVYGGGNVETERYEAEISRALRKAGVAIHLFSMSPRWLNPGISIYVPGNKDWETVERDPVVNLFRHAGFEVGWSSHSGFTNGPWKAIPSDHYALIIGPRPLPPDHKARKP
jgi:hypothetical protein